MTDDAAAGAVFLIHNLHGGARGCGESGEVSCVQDDSVVCGVERDVADSELLSAVPILAPMACVFANT